MKVIAAVNGLITSDIAAFYALRYAALFNYTLTLLHVRTPNDSESEVDNSMAAIEEAAEEYQVKTERIVLEGEPAGAIIRYLRETVTDTLFCGTRMRGSVFEDSLSEKLTRLSLPANLAIVRIAQVNAAFTTETILLPIREDRLSVKKFAFVSSMAKAFDAAMEIYSVTMADNRQFARMDIRRTRKLFQKINDRLGHYAKILKLMSVPIRIKHALAANEVDQILHHLAHHEFQLMIIGGRKTSGFSLFSKENTTARIIRYTPANTIVFYARDDE